MIFALFAQNAYCIENSENLQNSEKPITKKSVKKNKSVENLLALREIQTHYFNTNDEAKIVKAVISTLQDSGFVILNIEPELGYIYARKEMQLKHTDKMQVLGSVGKLAMHGTAAGLTFGTDIKSALATKQDVATMKNELALHKVIYDTNVMLIPSDDKKTCVKFSLIEKVFANTEGYSSVKLYPKYVRQHNEVSLYNEFFSQVEENLEQLL